MHFYRYDTEEEEEEEEECLLQKSHVSEGPALSHGLAAALFLSYLRVLFCFLQQCGIKNTQQSHGGSNAAI